MFLDLDSFIVKKIKKHLIKLGPLLVIYMLLPLHAFAGEVNVGINVITTPYYPPPAMVFIPDMQAYIAESSPFPVFYVRNGYYCFYNNMWYFGPTYNGPWHYVHILPIQIRRFYPGDWRMLQRQAHEYYRNPQWKHFTAKPDKRYYKYGHPGENNQYSPNNQQYNGGYNNNQYHQHNGYGR